MLSPGSVGPSVDNLTALIEVVRNPDKYKEQIEGLQRESKQFTDAREGFVQESHALQEVKRELEVLSEASDKATRDLRALMQRASLLLNDAIYASQNAQNNAITVVRDAEAAVAKNLKDVEELRTLFDQEFEERMKKLQGLDQAVEAREKRLAEVEARLEEIRGSI
jgi:DNA repair exonuclease SbcCD ATPase subunit